MTALRFDFNFIFVFVVKFSCFNTDSLRLVSQEFCLLDFLIFPYSDVYKKVYLGISVLVAQSCPTLCDPMDCSLPASLSVGFSRQEYWSGLPFPSPGDLSDPRVKLGSPELAGRFFYRLSHQENELYAV